MTKTMLTSAVLLPLGMALFAGVTHAFAQSRQKGMRRTASELERRVASVPSAEYEVAELKLSQLEPERVRSFRR